MRKLLLVVCALLPACERYRYQVDLTPRGGEMERVLVVESARSGDSGGTRLPREEAERLATLYGASLKGDEAKVSLSSRFKGVMPGDVGGAGSHTVFPTSLGTFHLYSERFRGNDDLLSQWERQVAAIDLLVDLSIAWSREALRGEEGLETLCAFLDGQFRRDIKNAGMYLRWTGAFSSPRQGSDEERSEEGKRRVVEAAGALGQYFVERGYIEPGEVPVVFASAMGDLTDTADAGIRAAQRQVLKRMGRSGAVPATLAVLGSWEAWADSIAKFLESSAEAKRLIEAWNGKRVPRLAKEAPELVGNAVTDAIGASILPDTDGVTLRLRSGVEPFATNGRWEEAEGLVAWQSSIEIDAAEAAGVPMVAFALWCEVDMAEQTKRLGAVRLMGEELAAYCLLRHALDEGRAKEWEAFLGSLSGGREVGEKLRAFRFKGDETAKEAPAIAKSFGVSK